jgi:hypothetical protein
MDDLYGFVSQNDALRQAAALQTVVAADFILRRPSGDTSICWWICCRCADSSRFTRTSARGW